MENRGTTHGGPQICSVHADAAAAARTTKLLSITMAFQVRTPTASQTPVLSQPFASSPSLRGVVPVTPVLPRQTGAYASPVPQYTGRVDKACVPDGGVLATIDILDSLEGTYIMIIICNCYIAYMRATRICFDVPCTVQQTMQPRALAMRVQEPAGVCMARPFTAIRIRICARTRITCLWCYGMVEV